MPEIPHYVRRLKHAIFQFFPGTLGLRNKACLHHLRKTSAAADFEKVLRDVGTDDILIDCGANVGAVSRVFAESGARVYAFEPDPWSFEQLSRNLQGFSNVTLHNSAVGTENGAIAFFRSKVFDSAPDALSLASSVNRRAGVAQEAIKVGVIDLVDFIDNLEGEIGILKLDIEGSEVPVLEKLFESPCLKRVRHIFAETHELQFPELLERTWRLRDRAARMSPTIVNLDWH